MPISWSKESKTTSKLLARIPKDRPDPKSRTAREIAWQIVGEEMIMEALETGAVKWASGSPPATMKGLHDAYDRQSAEIVRRWHALPAARWDGTLDSGQHPPMHGVFYSTSCSIVGRARRICAR